jgi:hypothetical protein
MTNSITFFSRSQSSARSAATRAASLDVCIRGIVGMALRAMCFLSLPLSRVASLCVYAAGDWFKMARVNAMPNPTEVIQ